MRHGWSRLPRRWKRVGMFVLGITLALVLHNWYTERLRAQDLAYAYTVAQTLGYTDGNQISMADTGCAVYPSPRCMNFTFMSSATITDVTNALATIGLANDYPQVSHTSGGSVVLNVDARIRFDGKTYDDYPREERNMLPDVLDTLWVFNDLPGDRDIYLTVYDISSTRTRYTFAGAPMQDRIISVTISAPQHLFAVGPPAHPARAHADYAAW